MKKILLIFLVTFVMLIPNVKADECVNLYKGTPGNLRKFSTAIYSSLDGSTTYKVSLDTSKYYTFYLKDGNDSLIDDLSFKNVMAESDRAGSRIYSSFFEVYFSKLVNKDSYTFKPKKSSSDIDFFFTSSSLNTTMFNLLNSYQIWIVEGESVCIPTVEPTTDTTLTGFYNIYLNKLGMLADFTTENKYFSYFIGIILLFICLEIFLSLFFIKGRRSMK